MVSQQSSLTWIASGQDVRIESPLEIRRKMLGHFSSSIVDLQQVTRLFLGPVVAAAVPQVAAEE